MSNILFITIFVLVSLIPALIQLVKGNTKSFLFLATLSAWHLLFCYFYYLHVMSEGGDALMYYKSALSDGCTIDIGRRHLVICIASLGLNVGASTPWALFIFFSCFGMFGFYLLFLIFKKLQVDKKFYLLLFLPGMHYWSVAIGKDSIVYLGICMILFGAINKFNKFYIIPGIFIVFMIRPHIAAIFLFSLVLATQLISESLIKKIIIFVLLVPVTFITVQYAIKYVGLEDISSESVSEYVDKRDNFNSGASAGIQMQSMHPVTRWFSYVFRPLLNTQNVKALAASAENTIILFSFLYLLRKILFLLKKKISIKPIYFFLILCLLGTAVMAQFTINIGAASRQKYMFITGIFVAIAWLSKQKPMPKIKTINK